MVFSSGSCPKGCDAYDFSSAAYESCTDDDRSNQTSSVFYSSRRCTADSNYRGLVCFPLPGVLPFQQSVYSDPAFLYVIMFFFSISPYQHYSLFFAVLVLLVETLFMTNITILLPIDSMRAALNSIVKKVNDPLVNLTLLQEHVDLFLAEHISNYMVYSTLIKKAIQELIDAFPQYFQVVQYTVEMITKSISELFDILVKLLNILFRPGLSTIINPCLTFVYGACMFLKPASRGPQTA